MLFGQCTSMQQNFVILRYAEWMVWFTAPTYFLLLYYLRVSLYYTLLIILAIAFGVAGELKLNI